MRELLPRLFATPFLLSLLAISARAQFNDQWAEYARNDSLLGLSSTAISSSNTEVDMAWADLDQDGDTDVVVVRKQPFTSAGKRTNILLRNDGGVLNDATSLATDSDVPGDQGFSTPTNDRDVVLADMDGDGDLEAVTATTLSDGDAKHVGHPRVYINKGGAGASWQGLRFEDSRIPQLLHYGTGTQRNPRFCSVATGDVTGDGALDLYFGDYDSSGAGGLQQGSSEDLNDRLLINDGAGFFSDESQARMTTTMLKSAFGTSVIIHDFNQDGVQDIMKDTALNAPQYVAVSYNNPSNEGVFSIFDDFHTNAPYHVSEGDLNNDGRTDVVITDDGSDRVRINTGTDPLGRVIWSSSLTFDFLTGGDDGFGSNNLVVDLDGDGWNDVLICDVDVDIEGCGRRLHIYHNETTQIGASTNSAIRLTEERQSSGSGWVGAVGITASDLQGAHDVAVFDLDGDSDMDMLLSRCTGTFLWENKEFDPAPPQPTCQADIGFQGPGTASLEMCGDPLASGGTATIRLYDAPAFSLAYLSVSFTQLPLSLFGGTLVAAPPALVVTMFTGSDGTATLTNIPGGGGPATLYLQSVVANVSGPGSLGLSNALQVEFLP